MKPIRAMIAASAVLFAAPFTAAQSVYVNFRNAPPGDYDVKSGSIVTVRNTTQGDVTIQVPYDPPITLAPGESTIIVVRWSPGGSTYIEGPTGNWRFNPGE